MSFNPLATKPVGSFAARVEAARLAREQADATALSKTDQLTEAAKEFSFAPPEFATEALGIVFDNSSSMCGQKVIDAREGTEELMRACTPNETAVKLIPLNNGEQSQEYGYSSYSSTNIKIGFTCDLPTLALQLPNVYAEGGTPLYERIQENLEPPADQPKIRITRMVVFSDGEPDPSREPFTLETTIAKAKSKGVILDTVYISDRGRGEGSTAYRVMKSLADETGGYFMVYERGKTQFKDILKYLSKEKRKLLADKSFMRALESGEVG